MGKTIHPPNVDERRTEKTIHPRWAQFQQRFYLDSDIFKLRYVHLQACYSEQVFKLVQTEQRKTG
jgi:hypothetical protein